MPSRTVVFIPNDAVLRDVAEFLVRASATVDSCLAHEDGVDFVFNVDNARQSSIGDVAQSHGFTFGGKTALRPVEAEEKQTRQSNASDRADGLGCFCQALPPPAVRRDEAACGHSPSPSEWG